MSAGKIEEEWKRLHALAELNDLLGHPIRLKIIAILMDNDGASWSDIVGELEKVMGRLNPNTVNFHLSKLISGGIVEKRGDDQYSIAEGVKDNEVLKAALAELRREG
jgi:DNA-binding transcriptional ArsR family regulator